jgi:hypothetical protein
MATWSQKQQRKYLVGFIFALVLLIGVPTFFAVYDAPTCSDGIQNGDEEGLDCGGVCQQICSFDAVPPTILWSRSFQVVDGFYNAVALIQNSNIGAEAQRVPYVIKVRDNRGILITERKGRLYIPPQSIVPVFETGLQTGEAIPSRTTFEFAESPLWERAGEEPRVFQIENRTIDETVTDTRLIVTLTNRTLDSVEDARVIAILFDVDSNAIAASETLLKKVAQQETRDIVFTWPGTFADTAVRSEVYPIITP